MKELLKKAKLVSYKFAITPFEKRKKILFDIAYELENNIDLILLENKKDLEKMDESNPLYDRLYLNKNRIKDIIKSCLEIVKQKDVIGGILEKRKLSCGLNLKKICVPIGVIACIYEARPNVTIDIAALCLFTGNTVVLRGSSSAEFSNQALIKIIHKVLESNEIPKEVVSKFSTNRDDLNILFKASNMVDMLIPRGGKDLIDRVRCESIIPTVETGAGVCHTYVDDEADFGMARNIIFNAKTQRPSVCNALDCMIVHENIPQDFFEKLFNDLKKFNVLIHADKKSKRKFPKDKLVLDINNEKDVFGKEFLGYEMSVKTVSSVDEAIDHINSNGSRHSEAIISLNDANVNKFFQLVDASSLYKNASTRFTDGGVFGFGAEIGISTQKLHARGPMGASTLTTYKYILEGKGEVRE